jgi:chemotaxis response regulator CheB
MPKVLVVDDHAFIRRGVRSILERFPEWELCGEAENGEQAVQKTFELHPAVVVMDVSMPVLDGLFATALFLARRRSSTYHQFRFESWRFNLILNIVLLYIFIVQTTIS